MHRSNLPVSLVDLGRTTLKVRKVDFSPDEFIAGVVGMTPAEIGVYWLVCSLIYSTGAAIPQDDERLRALRCDPRTTRAVIASLVAKGKIEIGLTDEMMVRRCHKEIESARRRIQLSAEAGSRGGRPAVRMQENQPLNHGDLSSPEKASPSPLPPPSPIIPLNPPKGPTYSEDFLAFWQVYPHKVGKDAAWRAWQKRKDRPEFEDIRTAVQKYIAAKPVDREFCNPATWLNQGRWNDAPVATIAGHDRAIIPPCPTGEDKVAWYLKHAGESP